MSDQPCQDCTPLQQCDPCLEAYRTEQAEKQATEIAAKVNNLAPELQQIALGIVLGLQQITQDQTDDINTFIGKVKTNATANPEIAQFLKDLTNCFLTPWEYELVMRCLNALECEQIFSDALEELFNNSQDFAHCYKLMVVFILKLNIRISQ
jgi:hypothetical protein